MWGISKGHCFCENVSDRIFFLELNVYDETQGFILDEVSELPVPRTHFDRQRHTRWNFRIVSLLLVLEDAVFFTELQN